MRVRRLHLVRYGHFTDFTLDLGDGAGLHLVSGPNEAGKSTLLHGLLDALFEIGNQSTYAFRHAYADMLVGAEIEAADGSVLDFRRRKGRRDTLRGADGTPLPETALAPFLGGADRALFAGMFGLGQYGLREGGEQLLQGEGEAGLALFGAASGLGAARAVLTELETTAGRLFRTGRGSGNQRVHAARKALEQATRTLKDSIVGSDEVAAVDDAIAEHRAELEGLKTVLADLTRRSHRLKRIERVAPVLAEVRRCEDERAGLGPVPELSADAAGRRDAALQTRATGVPVLARIDADRARVGERLAAIVVPEALLAGAERIEPLRDRAAAVEKGLADLPHRREELAAADHAVAVLMRRLGREERGEAAVTNIPPEAAVASVPPEVAVGRLRRLAEQAGRLDDREARAAEAVRRAAVDLDEVTKDLAALDGMAPPGPLAAAVTTVREKGDVVGRRQAAERAAAAAAAGEAAVLAALPLWAGPAEALERAPVPDRETVLRFEKRWLEVEQHRRRTAEGHEAAVSERAALRGERDGLAAAGPLPTAEAVAAARYRRDAAWRAVRRWHVDGERSSEVAPGPSAADALEALVRDADALADRKEAEAERLARFHEVTVRLHKAEAAAEAAAVRAADATAAEAALAAEWTATWAPCGVRPLPPRDMAAWLAGRERVLAALDARRRAESERAATSEAVVTAGDLLAGALVATGEAATGEAPDGRPLPVRLAAAQGRLDELLQAAEARTRRTARRDELVRHLAEAKADVAAAAGERAAWRDGWREATAALGRPAGLEPADVDGLLRLYEDLRLALDRQASLRHRIAGICGDHRALADDVADVVAATAPDLAGTDVLVACRALQGRLETARRDRERRDQGLAERSRLADERAGHAAALGEAEAVLAALRAEAGVADDDALRAVHDRVARHHDLAARIETLAATLSEVGDGFDRPALEREIAAADLDGVAAEHEALEREREAAQQRLQEASAALAHRERDRAELEAGRGAAGKAAAVAEAQAELRDAADAYMLTRTAAFLLRRAVEDHRRHSQGPVLTRAAVLFAELTGGSFAGVAPRHHDDGTVHLVAERPDGTTVSVDGLSDGTGDALFLALRLATVEDYLDRAEPLPFVADDLLVNLDDERAAAALRVLAGLARRTQVLFFTHHDHLVELAEAVLERGRFRRHAVLRPG